MLDLKDLRNNLDEATKKLASRQCHVSFAQWIVLDRKQRNLKNSMESLKAKQNKASEEIKRLKKEGLSLDEILKEMKQVDQEIDCLNSDLSKVDREVTDFLLNLPNFPHPSTPIGANEVDNVVKRSVGEVVSCSFQRKSHWEIGERLKILDFERGAKITGSRFTLYRGAGARLERALINFMLDLHTQTHSYKEMLPPFIVNRESMVGTGQLPKFEDDLFKTQPDYFLIPTAEVPLTNIHRNEILAESDLPIRYVAYTPCFRREAGTYGRDTRGLIRQHQFNKVELVQFVTPTDSYKQLEHLLGDAEEVLKRLSLPYRVVLLCTGDLGFAAAKTYDIEVWMPSQGVYREVSSCSHFEAFQARRAKIRYRTTLSGEVQFVHTLNGSALAIGRTVAAILENYQQEDGTVKIPDVLCGYMGGMEKIGVES